MCYNSTYRTYDLLSGTDMETDLEALRLWSLGWLCPKAHIAIWSEAPLSVSPVKTETIIESQNHKIVQVKEIHKNLRVQLLAPHRTTQKTGHVSENIVQMFLELCKAWYCDYFPVEPVPVPNQHLLVKNIFLTPTLTLLCSAPALFSSAPAPPLP